MFEKKSWASIICLKEVIFTYPVVVKSETKQRRTEGKEIRASELLIIRIEYFQFQSQFQFQKKYELLTKTHLASEEISRLEFHFPPQTKVFESGIENSLSGQDHLLMDSL